MLAIIKSTVLGMQMKGKITYIRKGLRLKAAVEEKKRKMNSENSSSSEAEEQAGPGHCHGPAQSSSS